MLNDDIIGFSFNNEVFSNEITDLITNFNYGKNDINIDEKEVIYTFVKDNDGNNE